MNDDMLTTRLAEYNTVRAESLKSMEHRNQIAAFWLGGISFLGGGAMVGSPSPVALTLVFCFAIPLISFFAYYLWFAEFERMVRAGRHLQRLEFSINTDHFDGQGVLTWESDLRTRRLRYPYLSGASLFLGVALFSPFVAASLAFPADSDLRIMLNRLITRDFLEVGAVGVAVTVFAFSHSFWRLAFPRQQDLPSRSRRADRGQDG